jgi:hypothetical protein
MVSLNKINFFMGKCAKKHDASLEKIAKRPSKFFPWMHSRSEFMALLASDPLESDISSINMLSDIKAEVEQNCTNKRTRETASALINLFERIYPKDIDNLRDDGSYIQDHPLTISYRCLRSGADLDVILAALLHDAKEDDKLKNLSDLEQNLLIPKTMIDKRLLLESWYIVRILTHKLSGSTIKENKIYLKKHLTSAKDLNLSDIHNRWIQVRSDYITYVTTLYQSGNISAILLKEMDTLHNLQSAYHLNPIDDFYRIFTTMWKALTHIDHAKKLSYSISTELIKAIARLWDKVQNRTNTSQRTLYEMGHDVYKHQFLVSDDQLTLELQGYASPPPRLFFNPRRAAYDRTVPEINMPREGQWMQTIKSHRLPTISSEMEFPLKRYPNLGIKKREYVQLEDNFDEVKRGDLRESIKKLKIFDMVEMPSMQFPALRSGVMIFEIQTPDEIISLGKKLITNDRRSHYFYTSYEQDFWRLIDEYSSLLVESMLEIYSQAAQTSFDKRAKILISGSSNSPPL